MSEALLQIKELKVYFPVHSGINPFRDKLYVKAVDGVSLNVFKGEALGVVGESGCGKTTIGHTIVRLNTPTSGTISFEGENIFDLKQDRQLELARRIQIIFQDPYSSLDPRFTVSRCIEEPLIIHKISNSKDRRDHVVQLMRDVGLHEEQLTKFPHEFSGGQRQRIGVARALALQPSIIVCDEPVSALDVSIQAQILNLMQELQKKYHLTYVFISHNLGVVNHLCDRIAVMYLGNLMEISETKALFANPKHPYTQALLDAIPIPDPERKTMNVVLTGDVPSPINPPKGCVFHARCPKVQPECVTTKPALREVEPGRHAACHFA